MIKVLIFDADGVMINGERFSNSLERDYGISIDVTLPFFEGPFQECLIGKIDLKEAISPYLSDWGWNKGVDSFLEYWFNAEHTINNELVEYIQELRSKGVLCFLATNNEKYRFQYMLEQMGFSKSFDKTYASAHLGYKKPDIEFFSKIFNELNSVKKSEIWFFDDDTENVKSAKEFGINAEIYTSFEDFKKIFMQKITDIYKEYKIMPNLQMHQLRVTAVALQICENFDTALDKDSIIKACLLHDMGNIIKSDLDYFPEFLKPEGREYWAGVQNEYFEKYGHDEHHATIVIMGELGVAQNIIDIVDLIGYSNLEKVFEISDFQKKICAYADFRVGPHGVLSLGDRAKEGKKRYENRVSDTSDIDREIKQKLLYELEGQIFSHCSIKPEDINDTSVAPYIEELKDFEI